MRLHSLRLLNFRQHADTRIDFGPGMTGIIGPNGAGKSTILEAIAWSIYGIGATRGTRESIRFNRAPARSPVRAELDFELGGHRYRIVRGLTNAELYLDGAGTPIANSITGVTDLVTRRLGMSRDEFFNTYFTGQKELSVMAAMGPSERAQFLSRVLGYERLRAAQELVRERRRTIVAEMAGLRQAMPDPDVVSRMVAETEARLAAMSARADRAERRREAAVRAAAGVAPRWESAQRERENWQQLVAELRVTEEKEAGQRREFDRLERELGETANARAEMDRLTTGLEPFAALASEFQRLDVLAREEGRRRALFETQQALGQELARLRDRHVKLDQAPRLEEEVTGALTTKRAELEESDGLLEARRTEWVRDRQEAETKRESLRDHYAELKEQRARLVDAGPDGACPTCTRPLGGNYQSVLELLDSQIETVRVDGNYYRGRLEQLQEMPEDVRDLDERRRALSQEVGALERRLTKVQLAVHELAQVAADVAAKEQRFAALARDLEAIPAGYDAERHDFLRHELDRLAPLDARAARLGALIEREPQLLRERQRVAASLAGLEERLRDMRARRDAYAVAEADFAALRGSYERATRELHAAELEAATAASEATGAETALRMARQTAAELAERQRILASLGADRRLHDELDRAYSDLRTDLNFQLRPELSELASAFLTELTDARYAEVELDDQYNVIVLEDGIAKPVISGGEEDLANLVLRLAISQMIAERAGQPFSILILDEIFGSLDEARRVSVLDLLRGLQDRFEQVILITHIESVREGLDRVINVRFDEQSGSSIVEQSSGELYDPDTGPPLPEPMLEEAGAAD